MTPIHCLLVDDEYLALALLEQFLSEEPDLVLVDKCRSPIRAVEILQQTRVDLLFLDIQMPVLSGTSLLKSISRKPITIFTTAYANHAHEAFDLNAVDYLLKPFSQARFRQAVQKARDALRLRQLPEQASTLQGELLVKSDRRLIKIPFADIHYIEGWKEYVKIYTGAEKIVTLESLNKLEEILPDLHFLRVHKSYIVARGRVQAMDGDSLLLGETRIPVARARKKEVQKGIFG